MATELQFLGGAGAVTGSKYLVSFNGIKILVDCGLFQGLKSLRLKNWEEFPVDPSQIHAVLLTHAHIDHSGYIPRLIRDGFKGKIYATHATKDVCGLLLPDAGYLMEEEAQYLNKTKHTKHHPALPLFTQKEGERALQQFEGVPFETKINLSDQVGFEFGYVGHILGAASIMIHVNGKKIVFTGDIGRPEDQICFPPSKLSSMDVLVTESTYGNRLHAKSDVMKELEDAILETYKKNGVILVPAFAVERAQTIMYYLSRLRDENRIPKFPMYLNSPMASDFSDIFSRYGDLHKLNHQDLGKIRTVMKYVRTPEESKLLNSKKGPMLIVSASGMLTGGRILHHLKAFAPYPENTILLTGFQAAGTRGEALVNGATELKIHGDYVPIRATVKVLENMSAHADYQEIMDWFFTSDIHPAKVFITHGEPSAADDFRRRLTDRFGWNCLVPEHNQKCMLF